MKASQPVVSLGSSNSFITGLPGVIPAVEWFEENITDLLVDAVDNAVADATDRLQEKAENIEGWDVIADDLRVTAEQGQIIVGHRTDSQEMNFYTSVLEYGTGEQSPSPLLRKTLQKEESRIPSAIHAALEQDLPVA
jgi:hypothetical protein